MASSSRPHSTTACLSASEMASAVPHAPAPRMVIFMRWIGSTKCHEKEIRQRAPTAGGRRVEKPHSRVGWRSFAPDLARLDVAAGAVLMADLDPSGANRSLPFEQYMLLRRRNRCGGLGRRGADCRAGRR